MLFLVILSILFTWLLVATTCIGIGGLLLRGFRFPFSPLDAFWTGLALVGAILQLYHFFRPIDLVADFLFFGLALAGWFWNRRSFLQQLRELPQTQPWAVLLYIPAVCITAFRAAAPSEHYDTGLYGAQAIRWITAYPVVPGLGNLLGQLGFNSSVHLWMAVLDQGPWRHLSHHLFGGFLIVALFAYIVPAAVRIFLARKTGLLESNISASDWFLTLLFIPAAIWAARAKFVGANTDLPTAIVSLVAAFMVLRGLEEESGAGNTEEKRRMSLAIAMLLFSLAAVFKLSSLVFSLLGWILAGIKLWSLSRQVPRKKWLLAGSVILSGVIVLGWIGRGLVLTGYPFFPSAALSIPFEWRVPAINVHAQADFARSFARIPQIPLPDMENWHWLQPWFRELVREREGFLIPLFFAAAGGVVALFQWRRGRQNPLPQWLWLVAPALAGLIFWFFAAPAMRFGEPVIWTAGATLGTLAAIHFLNRPWKRRAMLFAMLLMTGWAAHPRLLWSSCFRPSLGVRTFLLLPQAQLEKHQTVSGLAIHVPVETNQCWDAPLPCSFNFSHSLRLRRTGEMKHGFVSEGITTDLRTYPPVPR